MRWPLACLVGLCGLVLSAGPASAGQQFSSNLVTDGDFSQGFSGWTLTQPPAPFQGSLTQANPFAPGQAAWLGKNDDTLNTLSQNLATTPGQTYMLAYSLASGSSQANLVNLPGQTTQFVTSAGNSTVFNQTNFILPLTLQKSTFTATSTSTPLQFAFMNDADRYILSNVSVTPVPPPVPPTASPTSVALAPIAAGKSAQVAFNQPSGPFAQSGSGLGQFTYNFTGTAAGNGEAVVGVFQGGQITPGNVGKTIGTLVGQATGQTYGNIVLTSDTPGNVLLTVMNTSSTTLDPTVSGIQAGAQTTQTLSATPAAPSTAVPNPTINSVSFGTPTVAGSQWSVPNINSFFGAGNAPNKPVTSQLVANETVTMVTSPSPFSFFSGSGAVIISDVQGGKGGTASVVITGQVLNSNNQVLLSSAVLQQTFTASSGSFTGSFQGLKQVTFNTSGNTVTSALGAAPGTNLTLKLTVNSTFTPFDSTATLLVDPPPGDGGGFFSPNPVPEPSALLLTALGAGGLGLLRWRRRRAA
jgi:hypothetical protein